jgi:hypothetical protein
VLAVEGERLTDRHVAQLDDLAHDSGELIRTEVRCLDRPAVRSVHTNVLADLAQCSQQLAQVTGLGTLSATILILMLLSRTYLERLIVSSLPSIVH